MPSTRLRDGRTDGHALLLRCVPSLCYCHLHYHFQFVWMDSCKWTDNNLEAEAEPEAEKGLKSEAEVLVAAEA